MSSATADVHAAGGAPQIGASTDPAGPAAALRGYEWFLDQHAWLKSGLKSLPQIQRCLEDINDDDIVLAALDGAIDYAHQAKPRSPCKMCRELIPVIQCDGKELVSEQVAAAAAFIQHVHAHTIREALEYADEEDRREGGGVVAAGGVAPRSQRFVLSPSVLGQYISLDCHRFLHLHTSRHFRDGPRPLLRREPLSIVNHYSRRSADLQKGLAWEKTINGEKLACLPLDWFLPDSKHVRPSSPRTWSFHDLKSIACGRHQCTCSERGSQLDGGATEADGHEHERSCRNALDKLHEECSHEALQTACAGTVLYQLCLSVPKDSPLYGALKNNGDTTQFSRIYPDYVFVEQLPGEEHLRYVVVDAKASVSVKLNHQVQVALYQMVLRDVLVHMGRAESLKAYEYGGVWLQGTDAPSMFFLDGLTAHVQHFIAHEVTKVLSPQARDEGYSRQRWHYSERCLNCPYHAHCAAETVQTGTVSAIPHLSLLQKQRLESLLARKQAEKAAHALATQALGEVVPIEELHTLVQEDAADSATLTFDEKRLLASTLDIAYDPEHLTADAMQTDGDSADGCQNGSKVLSALLSAPELQAKLSTPLRVRDPLVTAIGRPCISLPKSEDVAVFVTVQIDPSSASPYAWAIGIVDTGVCAANSFDSRQMTLHEADSRLKPTTAAAQQQKEAELEASFVRSLYEVLNGLHDKRVCVYMLERSEQRAVTDLLLRFITDSTGDNEPPAQVAFDSPEATSMWEQAFMVMSALAPLDARLLDSEQKAADEPSHSPLIVPGAGSEDEKIEKIVRPRCVVLLNATRELVALPVAGFYSCADMAEWLGAARNPDTQRAQRLSALAVTSEAIFRDWSPGNRTAEDISRRMQELLCARLQLAARCLQELRHLTDSTLVHQAAQLNMSKTTPFKNRALSRMHFLQQFEMGFEYSKLRAGRAKPLLLRGGDGHSSSQVHLLRLEKMEVDKGGGWQEVLTGENARKELWPEDKSAEGKKGKSKMLAHFSVVPIGPHIKNLRADTVNAIGLNWVLSADNEEGRREQLGIPDILSCSNFNVCKGLPRKHAMLARLQEVSGQGSQPTTARLEVVPWFQPRNEGDDCLSRPQGLEPSVLTIGHRMLLQKRYSNTVTRRLLEHIKNLDNVTGDDKPVLLAFLDHDNLSAWAGDSDRVKLPEDVSMLLEASGGNSAGTNLRELLPMTASQNDCFRGVCGMPLQLVWGPPGAGKTYFCAATILRLAVAHRRAGKPFRVLVTAFTHAAIDNLLTQVDTLLGSIPVADGGGDRKLESQAWTRPLKGQGVKILAKEDSLRVRSMVLALGGSLQSQWRKEGPTRVKLVIYDDGNEGAKQTDEAKKFTQKLDYQCRVMSVSDFRCTYEPRLTKRMPVAKLDSGQEFEIGASVEFLGQHGDVQHGTIEGLIVESTSKLYTVRLESKDSGGQSGNDAAAGGSDAGDDNAAERAETVNLESEKVHRRGMLFISPSDKDNLANVLGLPVYNSKGDIIAEAHECTQCVLGATVYQIDRAFGIFGKADKQADGKSSKEVKADAKFDLLVIDEASQMLLAQSALALQALDLKKGRLLIVGDDFQLGPLLHYDYQHALRPGSRMHLPVYSSLLTYLRAMAPDFIPEGCRSMLMDNHRMCDELATLTQIQLRYTKDYRPCGSPASGPRCPCRDRESRDLSLRGLEDLRLTTRESVYAALHPGNAFVMLRLTAGGATRPGANEVYEAEATLVAEILGAYKCARGPGDGNVAFVVTPHHVQRLAVQRSIQEAKITEDEDFHVTVDTVEKMQGQQADLVLVCYGFLEQAEIENEMEFLYSRNRLVVALSRAKKKVVMLVGDEMLVPSLAVFETAERQQGFALLQELEQSCRTKKALQEVQVPLPSAVSDVDAVGNSLQDMSVPLSDDMDSEGAASGAWIPTYLQSPVTSPTSPSGNPSPKKVFKRS